MAVGTLKAYRSKIEQLREQELEKAIKSLEANENPQEVLERLSHNLINKIMHEPSLALKKAGAEERLDFINWTKELFGLSNNQVSSIHSNKDLFSIKKNSKKEDSTS